MSTRSKGLAGRLSRARRIEREADVQRVLAENVEDENAQLREHIASLEAQLKGAIAQRDDALARMAGAHRALDARERDLDQVRTARDSLRATLSVTRERLATAIGPLRFYADLASYDADLAPFAIVDGEVEHDGGARAHDALLEIGIDPPDPICAACGERSPDVDDDNAECGGCRAEAPR